MPRFTTILLALAALAFAPLAGRATEISLLFSYQDPNGTVSGDFTLTATAVSGDPGSYLASAGSLSLLAPVADNIAGNYTLVPNYSGGTNAVYSETGMFIYDDQVMPGTDPVVTNPGLLAFGGPGNGSVPEGKGSELNFFSSGANTYDLYTSSNGSYPYSYVFTTPQGSVSAQVIGGGSSHHAESLGHSLVAAPEPSTWAIMAGFLLITLVLGRNRKGHLA